MKNCKRKLLALFIRPGKEATTRNILRYALKYYLNGHCFCLCYAIEIALFVYYNITTEKLYDYIPEFTNQNAVKYFGGQSRPLWWPIEDWKSRYKFMKWLIKKYKL